MLLAGFGYNLKSSTSLSNSSDKAVKPALSKLKGCIELAGTKPEPIIPLIVT